jgi:hypothetical protein
VQTDSIYYKRFPVSRGGLCLRPPRSIQIIPIPTTYQLCPSPPGSYRLLQTPRSKTNQIKPTNHLQTRHTLSTRHSSSVLFVSFHTKATTRIMSVRQPSSGQNLPTPRASSSHNTSSRLVRLLLSLSLRFVRQNNPSLACPLQPFSHDKSLQTETTRFS